MDTLIKGRIHVRLALQVLLATATIWWLLYWFLLPIKTANAWFSKIDAHITSTFVGAPGSVFFLQILPLMVIAIFTFIIFELRQNENLPSGKKNAEKMPKVDIWTLPIILRSPFGILTLVDIIFITATLFVTTWFFLKSTIDGAQQINNSELSPGDPSKVSQNWDNVGMYMGNAAVIPVALLWLPVSRASPFLRVLGIPFESAVKYHTWLGILAICMLTIHGVLILLYFDSMNSLNQVWDWASSDIAVFPGVIALVAGLIMLTTALERVRRKFFNLFFATHHLYIVFLLFFSFHCVSQMPFVVIPVLLFFLDRFMRVVQSRKTVNVLSTRILPSGVMELKFARPAHFTYFPLSFLYMRAPSVSLLEWHPFSVASSPLEHTNEIRIYIKPLGGFTKQLHDSLIDTKHYQDVGKLQCPFSFKLSLEGPYGDETNFYLKYHHLVLVAGGIGVTPFLAIIRDLLHRLRVQQENLPSSVLLIFCVRDQKELCILDTLNPMNIFPDYEEKLHIKVQAYVTTRAGSMRMTDDGRKENSETQQAAAEAEIVPYEKLKYIFTTEAPVEYYGTPLDVVKEMSALAGTGHNRWVAATLFSTVVGYIILWGVFNVTFIDSTFSNYGTAILYFFVIALAVVVFGGGVLAVWAITLQKYPPKGDSGRRSEPLPVPLERTRSGRDLESIGSPQHSPWHGEATLGKRPKWKDIFADLAKEYEGKNTGVLVSGSKKMQEHVAKECRDHTLSSESSVAFHYHSVSFQL